MVKNQLRDLMLWVIAAVLVIELSKCHVAEIAWERHTAAIEMKKTQARTELSTAEIEDFIRLWPQFNELNLNKEAYSSYSVEKEELDLPSKIWFVYHQWDDARFSYVYRRLKDLMKAIGEKHHAEAVIKQLKGRTDEISVEMIKAQQRRLKELNLDAEEAARVEAKEDELKKLFKMYP